jgi:hypothetical protein
VGPFQENNLGTSHNLKQQTFDIAERLISVFLKKKFKLIFVENVSML